MKLQIKVDEKTGQIVDARFKTFGCGSAIASSSVATEWVKGKAMEEVLTIKNTSHCKASSPLIVLQDTRLASNQRILQPQEFLCYRKQTYLSHRFMFHVHEDFEAKCGLRADLYGHSKLINLPTNAVDVVGHMKLLNGPSFIERPVLDKVEITTTRQSLDHIQTKELGCNPYIANLVNAEEVTKAETVAVGEIFDYMKHGSAKVNLQL
ncbi:hypothetical protein YC2023_070031 [Brassica napus]